MLANLGDALIGWGVGVLTGIVFYKVLRVLIKNLYDSAKD